MIGTALLLLCTTNLSYAKQVDLGYFDNGCPRNYSINKRFPHQNWRQYYQCFHGALLNRICPNNYHYDILLEMCVQDIGYPHRRRQLDVTDPDDAESVYTSKVLKICVSPYSTGILIPHRNCNEYYQCKFGRPVTLTCPPDQLFNTMTEKCDWVHNVDCSGRSGDVTENHSVKYEVKEYLQSPYLAQEIERSNSNPNEVNAICASNLSDGKLVAHEYCNKFYRCYGNAPVTLSCPMNLLYNPIKEHCDWPRSVTCGDRIIPEYYHTYNNDDIKKNEENEVIIVNVHFNNYDVDDMDATAICEKAATEGMTIVHQICNRYYKCVGHRPVVFSCPGDLLYNPKQSFCDWSPNVDCSNRITYENDNESGNNPMEYRQAHTICSAEGSDGLLMTHEVCNLFYKCNEGRAVVVNCPPHLLYNPLTENCDWPTEVSCNDRIVPTKI